MNLRDLGTDSLPGFLSCQAPKVRCVSGGRAHGARVRVLLASDACNVSHLERTRAQRTGRVFFTLCVGGGRAHGARVRALLASAACNVSRLERTRAQALYKSDTAAPCYCGCEEQLEPEQIELLAAMTDVVMQPCARGNLRKAHRDAEFAEQ